MRIPYSVARLARLADLRALPSVLDIAWERRTGVNPVVRALEYRREAQKVKSWWICLSISLAFVIVAGAFLFRASQVTVPNDSIFKLSVICDDILVVFGILVAIISVVALFKPRFIDILQVELFWSDYKCFCQWTDHGTWLFCEEGWEESAAAFKFWDLHQLRGATKDVLVETTSQLIDFPSEEKMANNLQYSQYASLRKQLDTRFDTLRNLGLTEGSPHIYYGEARRRRKQKEQVAKPAAI